MRVVAFAVWCLVPLFFLGYHFGPGQESAALDQVDRSLHSTKTLAGEQDYEAAIALLNASLEKLPADKFDEAARIRLERARLQMLNQQLPEAFNDVQTLVDELAERPHVDPQLLSDAQATFANSQYYVTWLMRLEGRPREDWEPQVESARQIFRQLAEEAEVKGDTQASKLRREDLEASIRLARMDVGDLQGLPLPTQCQSCKSGKCNCKGKKPSKKPSTKTSQDARGASAGPPRDGGGN
ncbi:MAG: hypothetical protein C0478_01295 [Planctomyces sp.]|nr:hypothetical protein [Planctomyces sp.]